MVRSAGIRILFALLGLASLTILCFALAIGYFSYSFGAPESRPPYIFGIFLSKDHFIIGLIHLASLAAGILSFAVTFRPGKKRIRAALWSYCLVMLFLVLQILWSNFQSGGSLRQGREKERILQDEAETRFRKE